jgi:hypothetical protein
MIVARMVLAAVEQAGHLSILPPRRVNTRSRQKQRA